MLDENTECFLDTITMLDLELAERLGALDRLVRLADAVVAHMLPPEARNDLHWPATADVAEARAVVSAYLDLADLARYTHAERCASLLHDWQVACTPAAAASHNADNS